MNVVRQAVPQDHKPSVSQNQIIMITSLVLCYAIAISAIVVSSLAYTVTSTSTSARNVGRNSTGFSAFYSVLGNPTLSSGAAYTVSTSTSNTNRNDTRTDFSAPIIAPYSVLGNPALFSGDLSGIVISRGGILTRNETLICLDIGTSTQVLSSAGTTLIWDERVPALDAVNSYSVLANLTGNTGTPSALEVLRGGLVVRGSGGIDNFPIGTIDQLLSTNGVDLVWVTVQSPIVITPSPLTSVSDTNVTIALGGTPATALLASVSITAGWSGTLAVPRGGLGFNSCILGDIVFSAVANTLTMLSGNTTTTPLLLTQTGNGSTANDPLWAQVAISELPSAAFTTAANGLGLNTGTVTGAFIGNGSLYSIPAIPSAISTNNTSFYYSNSSGSGCTRMGQSGTSTGYPLTIGVDDSINVLLLSGNSSQCLMKPVTITMSWTGIILVPNGGTGRTSWSIGDMMYRSGDVMNVITINSSATPMVMTMTSSLTPFWSALIPADLVFAAALTRVSDTNITLTLGGTPTTALLAATSITMGWTGILDITRGGTGQSSFAAFGVGDLIYASASTTLAGFADVALGSVLKSGGVGTAPVWGSLPNFATAPSLFFVGSPSVIISNYFDVQTAGLVAIVALQATKTFWGYLAGTASNSNNLNCVYIGEQAGVSPAPTYGNNVSIGYLAGSSAGGFNNQNSVCIGYKASTVKPLTRSVFIGYNAGTVQAGAFGPTLTLIGTSVAENLTTIDSSSGGLVVIGYQAIGLVTAQFQGVVIGYQSSYNTNLTDSELAIGYQSLYNGTFYTNESDTAVGYRSLYNRLYSDGAVGVGSMAGYNYQGSDGGGFSVGRATFLGYNAGSGPTGTYNTVIGCSALTASSAAVSNTIIGYNAAANETGSNLLYIANSNTSTPLFYGTMAADATSVLTINSKLAIGGAPTASYALELLVDSAYKPTTTTWTISSDVRIKRDIRDLPSALNTVAGLRPRIFQFIPEYCARHGVDPDEDFYGFVADEVEHVMPNCVKTSTQSLETRALGVLECIKTLDSSDMLVMVVKAMQEMLSQIDEFKARIAAIKATRKNLNLYK